MLLKNKSYLTTLFSAGCYTEVFDFNVWNMILYFFVPHGHPFRQPPFRYLVVGVLFYCRVENVSAVELGHYLQSHLKHSSPSILWHAMSHHWRSWRSPNNCGNPPWKQRDVQERCPNWSPPMSHQRPSSRRSFRGHLFPARQPSFGSSWCRFLVAGCCVHWSLTHVQLSGNHRHQGPLYWANLVGGPPASKLEKLGLWGGQLFHLMQSLLGRCRADLLCLSWNRCLKRF